MYSGISLGRQLINTVRLVTKTPPSFCPTAVPVDFIGTLMDTVVFIYTNEINMHDLIVN